MLSKLLTILSQSKIFFTPITTVISSFLLKLYKKRRGYKYTLRNRRRIIPLILTGTPGYRGYGYIVFLDEAAQDN
jgi:hypothetical protein